MTDNNYCACNGGDANYIIRLNQQGAPGEKGDKGDQGFSPVVNYIANDDVVQFTLVNEGNIQTTPNFYDYFASKSLDNIEYDNPFVVNGVQLYEADANTSFVLTSKNNLGLQANESIGMAVSTDSGTSTVQVATGTTGVTISTGLGNIDLTSTGAVNIGANNGVNINGNIYINSVDANTNAIVSSRKNLIIQSDDTMGLQVSDSSNNINRVALNDLTDGSTTGVTIETQVGNIKLNSANIIDVNASDLISIYQGYSKQLYLGSSGGYVTMRGSNITIGESTNAVTLNSSGLKYDGRRILVESDITTMVTTDTAQTITGSKTFSGSTSFTSTTGVTVDTLAIYPESSFNYIDSSSRALRIKTTYNYIDLPNSEYGKVSINGNPALHTNNAGTYCVTLVGDQTGNNAITGSKQFKTGNVYLTGANTYIQNSDNSKNIARFGSDASYNLTINSYQTNAGIDLIPKGTGKVMYNGNEVAIKSDIPTSDDIEAHKAWTTLGALITLDDTTAYNNLKSAKKYSFDINKFIIQGSPTINSNHEMSNITTSDYASLNQEYSSGSWKIEFNAKCTQSASLQYFLDIFDPNISPDVSEIIIRRIQSSNNIVFYFFKTGKTPLALTIEDSSNDYYIAIEYNENTDTYKCTVNETTSSFNYTGYSLNTSSYYSISFGARTFTGAGADALTTGSIDLSSIKMTGGFSFDTSRSGVDKYNINGTLVEVPYVITNHGTKIVDNSYRERLRQVQSAIGSSAYILLDETNERFCLPYGNLYGAIGLRTLRDKHKHGNLYFEIYSDNIIEQGGFGCTANTPVTFLKPFANTDYVLSIPYSSKSTTGFVPSVAGDWIAKGDYIL